jgi:transcriptional regulator with GAF, ATPase, and Fis domain
MARLDARVKTDLPAKVFDPSESEKKKKSATIKELSLSGALIHGISSKSQFLSIRPNLPGHGEIELGGEIVRAENDLAAMRFHSSDKSTISALWETIKKEIDSQDVCPYCGQPVSSGAECCKNCGLCLNFEDDAYLDQHFKKTFGARIQRRVSTLDVDHLQKIIDFIDTKFLKTDHDSPDEEFVGTSPGMLEVFSMIRKVAPTDMNVLILGESGTGKELTARAIHERSERKDKPFVALNCAAIPESLLEAELFGHERGAFTGAYATRKGKFEIADGGTVFLDEIGDLSPGLQAKILRFLEDRIVERIGAKGGRKVNVRIVAATNCDLNNMVENGRFRNDLFFRLDAFTINLPPLRERGEDKVILARFFFKKIAQTENSHLKGFSEEAIEAIRKYHWPGNVRELINKVRRSIVMAAGEHIEPADMQLDENKTAADENSFQGLAAKSQKELVIKVLEENNFVIARSAKALGISRPSLYHWMKKFEIKNNPIKARPYN